MIFLIGGEVAVRKKDQGAQNETRKSEKVAFFQDQAERGV